MSLLSEMLNENDLIHDIIKLSPIGACWWFNYSEENVEHLFKNVAKLNVLAKTASIQIKEENRTFLLETLGKFDVIDWIIHQTITDDLGSIIFKSYDHMSTSILYQNFPSAINLVLKYEGTDLVEFNT